MYLKVLKLENNFHHNYWAIMNNSYDVIIYNEDETKLEDYLSNNNVMTFDGEYLIGRYKHLQSNIFPLDVIFYLIQGKKFEIHNVTSLINLHHKNIEDEFGYKFDYEILIDNKFPSIVEMLNIDMNEYFKKYLHMTALIMKSKKIRKMINDGFISNKNVYNHFKNIQTKICENTYEFNKNKIYINKTSEMFISNRDKDVYDNIIRNNNFYYPQFDALNAKTGRLGYHGKINPMVFSKEIKSLQKPKFDSIISIDIKNAEPAVLFSLSNVNFNGDLYNYIIKDLNLSIDRDIMKKLLTSYIYGAKTDERFVSLLRKKYPSVISYIETLINNARKKTEVYTPFGRKLFVEKGKEYKIVNNFVQSTFSDFFQVYINYLNKSIIEQKLNARILYSIHDEVLVDVNNNEFEMLSEISQQCLKFLITQISNINNINLNISFKFKKIENE